LAERAEHPNSPERRDRPLRSDALWQRGDFESGTKAVMFSTIGG
jgi:hypothetical protein